MERTAHTITVTDDLSLRVPDTDPATEAGRLGGVLNTMLDRLQAARQEQQITADRLRRFVDDAGHELRTPLTTIHGFAQLALRREHPSPEWREANELVAANAERMRILVDELLLLAKLDRDPAYDDEPVDLRDIATDVIRAATLHPDRRRITATDLTGNDILPSTPVRGDPHRLRQAAENLLRNALTHTPGGAAVEIRVGSALSGGSYGGDAPDRFSAGPVLPPGRPVAVLEVADHGPGLTRPDAERVFERFYRTDVTRARDRDGSGLGLAIASTIAEHHGGRLELDTVAGDGSTFRLVLPLAGENR